MMKKLIISLISIALIFGACSKDKEIVKSKNNTTINKEKPKNKTFQDLNADGITSAITTFQTDRATYWDESTYSDFTQDEALQTMSLVLNYEKGLYGYYEDVERDYYDVQITNNGKNEEDETLLNGGSVFTKFADIVDHLDNAYGSKELYYATFTLLETTSSYTTFRIHIIVGDRSINAPNVTIYNDFPVLPIGTSPSCSAYGSPQYIANEMTIAWNAMPTGPFACYKPAGTCYLQQLWELWADYDHSDIFHSANFNDIYASTYNSTYYGYINSVRTTRIALTPYPQKASHIYIIYKSTPNGYTDYKHIHYLQIHFTEYIPVSTMFDGNYLPIIP